MSEQSTGQPDRNGTLSGTDVLGRDVTALSGLLKLGDPPGG
jgi:hypothetical protein